jgi:CBS domain-containing protein
MTVSKIMRKDIVVLGPDVALEAAWQQMRQGRIGALPVADAAGRLVGVVAEHDLLARLAPRRRPGWLAMLVDGTDRLAADYARALGATVGDVMTTAPVAIVPDASIETAARLMQRHAIGVLPVVANDTVVGLVTRADVLDHLPWPTATRCAEVTDEQLQCLIQEGIQQELWTSRHRITAEARQGVIRLTGIAGSPQERTALLAMARAIPGCVGVDDRLLVLCRHGRRLPAPVI